MMYLIGGCPRSGKTTIAKQLSGELKIPYISTDTLESIVIKYTNNSIIDEKFPKIKIRRETKNINDIMYTKYSKSIISNIYKIHARSTYKAIEAFIDSESNEGHDYIVEGHHIRPKLINILKKKYKIKYIFIGRNNITDTNRAIRLGNKNYCWVVKKTKEDLTYNKIAEMLVHFSDELKKEAIKFEMKYISMDGDFNHNIRSVIKHLKK